MNFKRFVVRALRFVVLNSICCNHSQVGNEAWGKDRFRFRQKVFPVGLFKSDLYRSFGIGFALGAVALFASMPGTARADLAGQIIPHANAAVIK